MTDLPSSPEQSEQSEPVYPPYPRFADAAPARLPFSKLAIAGFVISCFSLFAFGWVGAIGALLSSRGLQASRRGEVRGRGLAIAGFVIGAIGFLAYAAIFLVRKG